MRQGAKTRGSWRRQKGPPRKKGAKRKRTMRPGRRGAVAKAQPWARSPGKPPGKNVAVKALLYM